MSVNDDRDRPIDPRGLRDAFDALVAEVEGLQERVAEQNRSIAALQQHKITVKDLPITALQRHLETAWRPSAEILLGERSITPAMLREDD